MVLKCLVELISAHHKRIMLRMLKTFYLQVNIKRGPLYCISTTHLHAQYIRNTGIAHPRHTIIGQEIILPFHGNHYSLVIYH